MKQEQKTVADAADWYKKGDLPPVGTKCEAYNHKDKEWQPGKLIMRGNSDHVFVTGNSQCWNQVFWADQFRPIQPKPQKIDISVFRDTGILMVDKVDELELYDHDTDLILHPHYGHWNAVKGLTEEPEWCKPFNVTVRYVKMDREFMGIEETTCLSGLYWDDVVAIRFDSVKEGFEV